MDSAPTTCHHRHGWLDTLAISASVVCGVHCLVTPVLLVALPVLATTFWVDAHFHLWMLGLVLPTSAVAVFLGCRKHKDKLVLGLCLAGLVVLTGMALQESMAQVAHAQGVTPAVAGEPGVATAEGTGESGVGVVGCASCSGCAAAVEQAIQAEASGEISDGGQSPSTRPWITANAMVNVFGGLLLVLAHGRNFWLCRSAKCRHDGA
ncbi:MAG: MerC domain-containing protein [Planctomycetota bacterium]